MSGLILDFRHKKHNAPPFVPPRFHDGIQSSPHWVDVVVHEEYLYLYKGSDVFATYPYAAIYVRSDWSDTNGAIFGFDNQPDAGLSINQKELFLSIQEHLHNGKKSSYRIPLHASHLIAIGLISIGVLFASLPMLSGLATLITYFIPPSLENHMGDLAISEMEKEFPACSDKEALASLQKITHRLTQASGTPTLSPELHLFHTAEINAFTLPGNKMAVLSGFLSNAASENEIAGVLAHEMGHMIKRDSLETFVESQGANALAIIAGGSNTYSDATKMAAFIQTMSYSRKKEFAADDYGAHLLIQAGYSPSGLSSFLKRTQDEETSPLLKALDKFEFLSTHPNTQERIQRIENISAPISYTPQLTMAEFSHLKVACNGAVVITVPEISASPQEPRLKGKQLKSGQQQPHSPGQN